MLGLGEASSLIAKGLADQGVEVVGFDFAKKDNPLVPQIESAADAVSDADVVLSLNSTTLATKFAEQVVEHLKPGTLYCDLNVSTPALKRKLSEIFPEGSFVDVAVMKPVAGLAEKVPLSVAGPGAEKFMALFEGLDMNVTYVSAETGQAAAHNLLSNMLAKNIAGAVIDYMWAAEQLGLQDWAFEELQQEFDSMTAATAKGYLVDTVKHAKRREIEMMDVVEMLEGVNYQSLFAAPNQLIYNKIYHLKKVPFSDQD